MATPGELWHQVEPVARERDGWVAFLPRETPQLLRTLIPATEAQAGSLLDKLSLRICTVSEALGVLAVADSMCATLVSASPDAVVRDNAQQTRLKIATARAVLGGVTPCTALSEVDRDSVITLIAMVDEHIRYDKRTENTAAIQNEAGTFYAALAELAAKSTCPERGKASPFRWWLIPLVLIGTAICVYHETRDRK